MVWFFWYLNLKNKIKREDNQKQFPQQLTTTNYRVQRQCIIRKGRAIIESLGCVYVNDGIKRLF